MAWTTPPDFVNGQLVTETQLDILSDDLKYLKGTGGTQVQLDGALEVVGDYRAQSAGPAFWLDQTGASAVGARWVLNGGALQLQARTAAYGGNIATPLIFIDMLNTPANTMRLGANGISIGLAGGSLSKLDVNGGVAIGSYAGANAAPSNGLIVSGAAGFGYASPAAGTLCINGKLGVGTNAPNGMMEVRDAVGGAVIYAHAGVTASSGAPLTVLPTGTASNAVLLMEWSVKASSASSASLYSSAAAVTLIDLGNTRTATSNSNTLTLSVNANGSVTLYRSAGTDAVRTVFRLMWL